MKRTVLPVGNWAPDNPDLGNTGITATNVLPWKDSYRSFASLAPLSTALTAACQGATFGRNSAGVIYNYAGDATKLYVLDSTGTYNDVSRSSGGAYATVADEWWEFAQWGNTLIATNFADAPQVITFAGAHFAALGGTPPKARHVAVIKDFLVFGGVIYGAVTYPNRLYWSAINNPADWTIAAATQCDIQDLQGDGGRLQKIIGGEFGLIFMERQVWRMSYIGAPVIFQFDLIERSRGAYCPQGVIGWGNMVFFIAEDGFYVISGGQAAKPIGNDKVDKYFLNSLKPAYYYRVNAAIDPVNKIVMWSWPGDGASSTGLPNLILAYNWAADRWSVAETMAECFARYASVGYSLEGLDTVSTNLDLLPLSLDSRAWAGGAQALAAFNSSHKLASFSGAVLDATVDTGERQLEPGMRSIVTSARPLVDGNAASVTMRTRERLANAPAMGMPVTQNTTGECPQRSSAFYHAARIKTTGAFTFIQGVELEHTSDGAR